MLSGILISIALVAVVVFVQHVRRRDVEWDHGSTMLFGLGWLYSLPVAAAKITGSFQYSQSPDGSLEVVGYGWASTLYGFADLGGVALAAFGIIVAIRGGNIRWSRVGASAILLILFSIAMSVFSTSKAPGGAAVLLLALVLAATFIPTTVKAVATGVTAFVLSFIAVGAVLTVVRPDAALTSCDSKCTIFGTIFTGAASHGNGVALIVTMALPFVWLALRPRFRFAVAAGLVVVVAATGSRTSLAMVVLILTLLVISRPQVSNGKVTGRGWKWLAATTLGVLCVSLAAPYSGQTDGFATGRGYLWKLAETEFLKRPFAGSGLNAWGDLFSSGAFGEAAAYSTHNQWLEVALIAGLPGLLLLGLMVFLALGVGGSEMFYACAPVVLAIFAVGILERPISISLVSSLTWVLLALIMVARSQQQNVLTSVPTPPPSRYQGVAIQSPP